MNFFCFCVFLLSRVQIITTHGEWVKTIGKQGKGPGEFNCPASVFVGSNDHIFVSDASNNRVQVFSKDGAFIRKFGTSKEMDTPWQITAHANDVFVADVRSALLLYLIRDEA